ncbi:MAG TPA: PKD domain-containing protein, partial [Thermoplasmatales archaeon]|nr:PKD domain-containing protein [Thermoplasmatales archaeon]
NDPSQWPDEIYYHYYGKLRGYHAVVLVGYDDNEGYWICKNSWGYGGLNGYFKIKYGECGIDDGAYYIRYTPTLTVDAGGPYYAKPGEEIQFYGNAYGGEEPYSYNWNFGDGTTSNEQNPKHAYSESGVYTVTLTVTDNNNKEASDTTKAIINTPPGKPEIIAPSFGKVNTPVQICFKSIDPDGDKLKYYIKWGDGREETTSYHASGESVCMQHTWLKEGDYVIRAQAKDDKGEESGISQFEISIVRGEPPYKPYDPSPLDNATGVSLNPILQWKGGDPNGDMVSYTIYFGLNGSSLYKIADNITQTQYQLYNLQPYTKYFWQVVAYDETGLYTKGDIWKFVTKDIQPPQVTILKPQPNTLYVANFSIPFWKTFIIGKIEVVINASDNQSGMAYVNFFVDGKLVYNESEPPYIWLWNEDTLYDTHILEIIACDRDGNMAKDSIEATVLNLFP